MINFLGGGEGLVSGAGAGGFGARFGLPWLTLGRSHKSEVDSEGAGECAGGVGEERDVILPPKNNSKYVIIRFEDLWICKSMNFSGQHGRE